MAVIEFRQFSRQNGDFGLQDLSFQVERGYITGLIGPNGSGKTTIIRAIMNLLRADQGELFVFGQSYKEHEREIKSRIGFVYDEDFYYNHLSLREMKKIVASFYPTWNESIYQGYLEQFGLPEKRKVRDLSRGMKTKFTLALALSHEPELLIMDEPTSGLDSAFRREILSILSQYIYDGTKSVLFSTHISTDLERIADYIVFIRNGKLQFSGSKEELMDSYMLVKGPNQLLNGSGLTFSGLQRTPLGFEGLLRWDAEMESRLDPRLIVEKPSLDDILVYSQGRS